MRDPYARANSCKRSDQANSARLGANVRMTAADSGVLASNVRNPRWSSGRDDQVLQLARVVGHHPAAVLGDDHGVGVAEAAQFLYVHAGLDREHHSRLENCVIASIQERRLMASEADRVADVVADRALAAHL